MKKWFIALGAAVLCLSIAVSASVSPVTVSAATPVNNSYTDIKTANSGIVLEPTMVFEPETMAELNAVKGGSVRPASIVVTPDKNMNVSFTDSTSEALREIIDTRIGSGFIPVVRLNNDTVDGFIDWMTNTYTKKDIMAISSDIKVIQKLYADEVTYIVNTVYDLTDISIPADRYGTWKYIGAANAAGCNVLMFDAADPNLSVAAEYVSAMTKCCWAYADDKMESVTAISAGCYGVVSGDFNGLKEAIGVFQKDGFTRAQFVAAHRGITAYCNENSLTAVAAAASEGATHVELDVQITSDGRLVMCHNSGTNHTAAGSMEIARAKFDALRKLKLNDYTDRYEETFPTIEEIFDVLVQTDVILILELKLDGASTLAVNQLKAIQTIKETFDKHPQMEGRWVTITFYAPYAEAMKEYIPEIPCCGLGGAQSGLEKDQGKLAWGGKWVGTSTDYLNRIDYMRMYNIGFDEMHYPNLNINKTAANYLARGYVQNTWTFKNVKHFEWKVNIATTDAAEQCAMFVKKINAETLTGITQAELEAGKLTVACETYSGWKLNKECDIVEVARGDGKVSFMLYYKQEASYVQEESGYNDVPQGETGDASYGLYSQIVTVPLA